ncbi:MAG: DUF5060 domain-containing protein [Armatimonadota bacterium]
MNLFRHYILFAILMQSAVVLTGMSYAADGQDTSPQPAISDNRPLSIGKPAAVNSTIPQYGKFEAAFTLQGTYANAFDPDEIDVKAVVVTPDGKSVEQPAFYFQEYARTLESTVEVLKRSGSSEWRVRFSPVEIGDYSFTIKAKDRTGATASTDPIRFTCVKSDSHGYVRISRKDKRYFAFDDGNLCYPTGANICWGSGNKATYDFDTWLPKYAESGCSYFRVWLGPGWVTFGLETPGQPQELYGAGKINLANAWRLDYVLDLASQQGLYVMLCIDSFNTLRKKVDSSYPYWEESPLNKVNGGPLLEPVDYWTNPEMLRLYRNKLRYLAARYGWSTNVFSWEFWNEVDIVSPSAFKPDQVTAWHAQMSDYLRKIDNWNHLQTTSFAQWPGVDGILSLPQMDYNQTHDYGSRDIGDVLSDRQQQREKYGKPHYIGEFGADAAGSDASIDPLGIAFHTGIWSSVMSGGAGTASSWWWDNHIEPHNLYTHLAALTGFIKGVQFDAEGFQRVENASFKYGENDRKPVYRDLFIQGPVSWDPSRANRPTVMTISKDGRVSNDRNVSGILHGVVNHAGEHNPLTINTDLPHPANIRVSVTGVSGYGGAHLVISLDGKTMLDKDMPDTDSLSNVDTIHQYDGIYEVSIPSGKHTVLVENTGTDWMFVDYIIEKAVLQTAPSLRAYGLRGKRTSLFWIENTDHMWYKVDVLKQPVEEQKGTILVISGWPEGRYDIQFWDTYAGKKISNKKLEVSNGTLSIDLPSIGKDLAIKINRR